MALPLYYHQLYVAICRGSDQRVVGSGICFDGSRIFTCAHVVNSALECDQTDVADKSGKMLVLRFSQSNLLDNHTMYTAKVIHWYPPEDKKLALKNDLAVLELEDADLQNTLAAPAGELRFVADDVKNNTLACISHNTMDADEDAFTITGTIQYYLPAEGKTQLSTSDNVNDAFFRAGSSGSPVYSELLNGISGIVDQRVDEGGKALYAFMIDVRRIADLFDDILVHRPSIQKKNREEKKFLCDRKQVIEGIATERSNSASRGNFFFLWGNQQQEGADFINRYRQQFLQPDDSNVFITVNLSVEEPALFQSQFFDALENEGKANNKRLELKPGDDIFTCYKVFQHIRNKVFVFHIPDFRADAMPCYQWFIRDFLKLGKAAYTDDLHILVMYEFLDSEATIASRNHDALLKEFGIKASFPLENVTRKDIQAWISLFREANSSRFKLKLLELLDQDKDYPMKAIFNKYNEAKDCIPDHEKL